jgi:hypothetical protein
MIVEFLCPACEAPAVVGLPFPEGRWRCPRCTEEPPEFEPGRLQEGTPISRCALCAGERFYVQRDFNQKVGCGIAGIGAVLSPFTYGISLIVCLGIDLVLYFLVKEVTVCYRCGAIYRGVPKHPDHGAFDLHVAEIVQQELKYLEPDRK